ncbi:Ppx/GppA phosphatase family protein [Cutibacterium sp.]|uniref:Ppx/GppA phosphatase family protein n=1 Tax=Cutibacterium sp. TaxID=1912221 RepID=UPI0026DA9218|nr:Ppx/GppA phosphatase family protein [Cutibacterium sp.]MDO4412959.1 Ppx/GppA phosphatase family protein [Cutibacterium sp.]
MTDNRTVAAIDCGTNSIRLLIASADTHGRLVEQARDLELVRLGQGVDAAGAFHPAALERTFAACRTFAQTIAEHHCEEVRFVATSAARDVSNRDEFFTGVREALGVDAEVIPGTEEASLSFAGAMSGIEVNEEPVLVIDCGGGSTELVVGCGNQIESQVSLNIGSVRLRERFLNDDPPTADQIDQARSYVRAMLDKCSVDVAAARTVVGVAGTVTSLSAIHQNLKEYDRAKVHRSVLTADQVSHLADKLLSSTVDEVEQMGPLKRRRAEVLCGGALIIDEVCHRATAGELIVSETDILDGMALAMLAEGN